MAKVAQDWGISWFAVATPDEAVELRKSCDRNILVMAPADEESNYELVQREISVTAFSLEHLRSLCKIAEELEVQAKSISKWIPALGASACARRKSF